MAQYGSYNFGRTKDVLVKDGTPTTIPFGETLGDGLFDFFGDCYCGIRTEEGLIFHLVGDKRIRVNVMDVTEVYPLKEYIGFSLEYEKKIYNHNDECIGFNVVRDHIIIPYDKIIYITILPHNPDTYKMG